MPPYFESNVNKINQFALRENKIHPPCPQEFFEGLINSIYLKVIIVFRLVINSVFYISKAI